MKTIKILFAEDHEMVRNGIKLMLNNQNTFNIEIDEASDGLEVISMANQKDYDVILLDVNLPGKDGVAVTKLLKAKVPRVRILALTMHKEEYIIQQMIDAGALGYILKNSGIEELTKAIMTVATFGKYYCNEVSQTLLSNAKKPIGYLDDKETNKLIPLYNDLTQREIQVLKLITQEYTNKEIGEKLKLSERTIGNHRNRLLQKLQVRNSIGLATFAVKNGIV